MEIIAAIRRCQPSPASLIVALRRYGFHPEDDGDGGLPGTARPSSAKGIPIRVPEEEADDCRLLAADLLKEMRADAALGTATAGESQLWPH